MAILGAILADRLRVAGPGNPDEGTGARGVADPWAGFLNGPENALAMAALHAMIEGEAEGLSPLLLHGPSGVGKSRLLAGLVGDWRRRHPGRAVAHVEAESFAAACAGAGRRAGDWADVRMRFREVDLFVLDDLLLMGRSQLVLQELDFTLDALEATGASVVITARTPPGQWSSTGLPQRLVHRMLGGLCVRLDPPGPDLRRRYALAQARRSGVALAAEGLDALLATCAGFLELDGALARLALGARLRGIRVPLGAGHVQSLGDEAAGSTEPAWDIGRVARAVASHFRVTLRELRSPSRRSAVVEPRHLAMHLARQWAGVSYARIGQHFGGRDPATVRHACHMAAQRIAARPDLAAAVELIRGR